MKVLLQAALILILISTAGCASTSHNGVAGDFSDGVINSKQQREASRQNNGRSTFNDSDVASGFLNVLVQQVLKVFQRDDSE